MTTDIRNQPGNDEDSSGARLRELTKLPGRDIMWLAKETSIPATTLRGYLDGGIKGARQVVSIARAYGVSAEWLMSGIRTAFDGNSVELFDRALWLDLPFYPVTALHSPEKPAPTVVIPLYRALIDRVLRRSAGLWLTEMPSNALPSVAREGDTIVCMDVGQGLAELHDQGVYLFLVHGRPIVRRVVHQPSEILLTTSDAHTPPMSMPLDQVEHRLTTLGRVVGVYSLHAL